MVVVSEHLTLFFWSFEAPGQQTPPLAQLLQCCRELSVYNLDAQRWKSIQTWYFLHHLPLLLLGNSLTVTVHSGVLRARRRRYVPSVRFPRADQVGRLM